MQKIKIAFIDDNESLLDSLQASYDGEEYEICTFKSLDEALPVIDREFFSFHFVILDGKGYLKSSETGHGDEKFAIIARDEINKLISIHQRDLPFCYFTAYSDEKVIQMLPSFSEVEEIRIFNKKEANGKSKMFEYINERYSRLEETTMKKRFPDIFEIFHLNILNSTVERDLISLISSIENLTDFNAKQFSRNVRPFMERICNILIAHDSKYVSPQVRQGDEQGLRSAIYFFAGKPKWNKQMNCTTYDCNQFMPPHLFSTVSALQDATSKSAMHDYSISINRYTALSYLYTLFDFMLWFKITIQK